MHTRTCEPPLRVAISTGKHSVVIPPGTEAVIQQQLIAAGFTTGEWKTLLGGFVKGTPHTPSFRVRGLEGRSIIIRVLPGGNDSCTQHRLIVPQPFDPQDVHDKLQRLGKAQLDQAPAAQHCNDAAEASEELTPTNACSLADVLADPGLTDLLLEVVLDQCGMVFRTDACKAVAAQYFEIPQEHLENGSLVGTLVSQGFVETAPCGEDIGYRLTRKTLERIGRHPVHATHDDLALTAGLRLSQLRADAEGFLAFEQRRDEIVAEMHDLELRRERLREQLGQVQAIMESHPGKTAATTWKKAQTLLELTT